MLPKDWILVALGRVLGVQDGQFGSNSMCFARTAALQRETKSPSECQHRLPAAIHALKNHPGRSKIEPGACKNAKKNKEDEPTTLRSAQEAAKSEKKGAQERKLGQHSANMAGFWPTQNHATPSPKGFQAVLEAFKMQ